MSRHSLFAAGRPGLGPKILSCLVLAIVLGFVWSTPARAQTPGGCEINELTQFTLKNLKATDEKVRISAGRSLVENWRASIPGLILELQQLNTKTAERWPESEVKYATFLTDITKTILSTNDQAIARFRQCDNDKVVRALAWAARGSDRLLRINSANILANVADNTTICIVLHHLQDKTLSTNGRANLLGVTVPVSGYAFKENIDAINATLARVQQNLPSSKDDLVQTQQLMIEIASRALKSSNANTALPDSLKDYCRGYPYAEPLN